jgi:hypothetical protein
VFKEDSVQFPSQNSRIPSSCIRPNVVAIPSGPHQCLEASNNARFATVQMTWQHVRTLFKVREDTSVQVHPSGRRGYIVQTLFRVEVEIRFHV